jgi:hypothetical protein
MCIDPSGRRLKRFAVCSCGAYFPECDLAEFLEHGTAYAAVNHNWVLIDSKWKGLWNGRSQSQPKQEMVTRHILPTG